jgi:hypothetical protein
VQPRDRKLGHFAIYAISRFCAVPWLFHRVNVIKDGWIRLELGVGKNEDQRNCHLSLNRAFRRPALLVPSFFEQNPFQSISYFEVDEVIKCFTFSSALQERRGDN